MTILELFDFLRVRHFCIIKKLNY